jgi:hypothetical protein
MTERLIEKFDRLAAEAGIKDVTPEIRRFAVLVRQDLVGWPGHEGVDLTAAEPDMREKQHELAVSKLNAELTAVYGLLAMAHLNIKQHLECGFNEKTANSTLVSVGRYYPRLKTEMEKNT